MKDTDDSWFLEFEGSRFGPLTTEEAHLIIKSGKLKGQVFAWKMGFREWKKVQDVPDLTQPLLTLFRSGSRENRKRIKERKSFVATVRFDNTLTTATGLSIYTGVCKDISPGGLLILSNSNIGYGGTFVHMVVSPVKNSPISPFEAVGHVAHVLPHERGFGVEFTQVPKKTKIQIEAFMEASIRFKRES